MITDNETKNSILNYELMVTLWCNIIFDFIININSQIRRMISVPHLFILILDSNLRINGGYG